MVEEIDIPGGWKEVEFGHLIYEQSKSKIQVSEASNHGTFPFFTSGETILIHDEFLIDGKNLFLSTGGVANVKFYEGKCAYSTDTYAIFANQDTSAKYLYYYLQEKLYYINSNYFLGSGLKHLQKKDLRKHMLQIPELFLEQRRVAEILAKVDKGIAHTDQLIAKHERIKIGLMQDLLTKGIDGNGNMRSEETHIFKDSPLGRIPVEWRDSKIRDIYSYSTSGSRGWAKYYAETGKNFITITSLERNDIRVNSAKMKYVNLPENVEGSRSKLEDKDILISITADLGIIAMYDNTFGESYINQHISLVRLNQNKVSPKFIAYYLSSTKGQSFFNLMNDGGAKAGLNLNTILKVPVIVPSKDEQLEMEKRIDKVIFDIDNLLKQREKLISLKRGLMQDLLSGKKRVTPLINSESV